MNPNIYEAALDLGATPAQAFRKVLLPELKPGMISGFILAVTLSVDDFAVTLFTKGSSGIDTLSTYIYADARKGGLTPELRPLSTLIFLCILALLIVINARSAKQARPAARPSSRSKKPLAAAALLLAALTLPAQARADVPRSQVLKVYNWADYIDEDLIPEFEAWYEARTGEPIHVLYETFDVNENMLTEIEMGHEDYDCVCPSEYIIERMLRADLLLPICRDFDTVPDYTSLVSPFALEKFEQMGSDGHRPVRDYAVGYMWGTTGFLYNTAYVSADRLSSWDALVDPDFRGRIFMKDAFRDIYSTLILYARYDDILAGRATRDSLVAHTTDENIAAVERVLTAAKPNIAGWEVDFGKEMMTKGKAWINVSWSGDAMWAIEEGAANGVTLDYVVPREGSNVWFDGWVIPRYARNPRAAAYFINFLCRPDNAIRNMEAIGYVSVIASPEIMEAMADPDQPQTYDLSYFFGDSIGADTLRVNPIMYPDRTVVARCALMHDCADRTEAMLEMWSRVKGDNLNWPMLVVVLLVVAAYVAYRVRRSLRRRRSRRRRLNRRRIG
jgi:spermidine/putrescine transport system substrate-binding protein